MLTGVLKGCGWLSLVGILAAASCEQPRVRCEAYRGNFAARYKLLEADDPNAPCAKLTGESIGVYSYNDPDSKGSWDPDKTSLAIQTQQMVDLVGAAEKVKKEGRGDPTDSDASHRTYSYGHFATAEPGSDDFCLAPKLEDAYQDIKEIPPDPKNPKDLGRAATKLSYKWTEVKVYATAAATGTQIAAELEYSLNDCKARYRVWAVAPRVSCADAQNNPDPDLCSPVPIPEKGITVGSGINPKFDVECDPGLLLCVLKNEPPSLTP